MKGGVCPDHLHLCILFYLYFLSLYSILYLYVTVSHITVQLSEQIGFCFSMLMVGLVSLSPVIEMSSSIHCLLPCNCYNMFKNRQVGALQP